VIETGQTVTQEVYIRTRDGTRQHCLIYLILMINAEGNLLGVLEMNLDITERK
jgi:PAS domain-containing protein